MQPTVAEVTKKALCCELQSSERQLKECLISTSGAAEVDSALNELRILLLRGINQVNQYQFNEILKGDLQRSAYFKLCGELLPVLLGSLYRFCVSLELPGYCAMLASTQVQSFVTELVMYL